MKPQSFSRRELLGNMLRVSSAVILAGCAPKDERPGVVQAAEKELDSLKTFERGRSTFLAATTFDSGVKRPSGIAVQGDKIVVVGERTLNVLDLDGKSLRSIDLGADSRCVTATPEGQIYVGLSDRVVAITPDGQRIPWAPPGPRAQITSISVDRDNVWVADAGSRLIVHYNGVGQKLGSFGVRDDKTGYEGLVVPSPYLCVVALPTGSVLVTNPGRHRVEEHGPDGTYVRSWGSQGEKLEQFAGCCNPISIAVLSDGSVVTAEKGISRIKLYGRTGTYVGMIERPDVFPAMTLGIGLAIDARGRVLAVEPTSPLIRIYAREREGASKS